MRAFIKMENKVMSFNQFVEFEGLSIQDGTMHLFKTSFSPVGTITDNMLSLPKSRDMAWSMENVTEFKMIDSK